MFDKQSDRDFKQAIFDAALNYAARNWAVFPLHSITKTGACTCAKADRCTDAGKHPVTRRGLKQASINAADIAEWFSPEGALRNIAIVTGAISGITVLDIDMGTGKVGEQSWHDVNDGQMEPITLMAHTGSGGLHAFFVYNGSLKTASNVLGKNIDCR